MNEPNLTPAHYIQYNPATGRITQNGTEAAFFSKLAIARGEPRLVVDREYQLGTWEYPDYVDLSGGRLLLRPRPVIDWAFDTNSVLPMKEATLAHVAPCVVSFTGPKSGTQDHPKLEDLKIGFKLPGVYELTFEAFPYRPAKFALQVQPTGLANLIPNVNLNLSVS